MSKKLATARLRQIEEKYSTANGATEAERQEAEAIARHTEGPWEAYETPGRWNVCHKSEGRIGGTFAEVRSLHVTAEAVAISAANARLIAAAPDLLKALVWIITANDSPPGATMGEAKVCEHYAKIARAAIAKATGK